MYICTEAASLRYSREAASVQMPYQFLMATNSLPVKMLRCARHVFVQIPMCVAYFSVSIH